MTADIRRSIIIVLLAGFIIINGALFLILRSRPAEVGWGREEPAIPSYPEAQDEHYQKIEVYGHQTLTFRVVDSYPSTKVLDYYEGLLKSMDYHPVKPDYTPAWITESGRQGEIKYTIGQFWVDPEGLRVLQLLIFATAEVERDPETGRVINSRVLPGEKVEITLSRKVFLGPDRENLPQPVEEKAR